MFICYGAGAMSFCQGTTVVVFVVLSFIKFITLIYGVKNFGYVDLCSQSRRRRVSVGSISCKRTWRLRCETRTPKTHDSNDCRYDWRVLVDRSDFRTLNFYMWVPHQEIYNQIHLWHVSTVEYSIRTENARLKTRNATSIYNKIKQLSFPAQCSIFS